jgi:hypothetical protein
MMGISRPPLLIPRHIEEPLNRDLQEFHRSDIEDPDFSGIE